MRIDKFLKVSRIIKRREIAAEACENGRVEINGKTIKPAKKVAIGDKISVVFGNRKIVVEVVELNEKATKAQSTDLYKIIEN